MHVSLIITTYNWTEALAVILHSAKHQSYTDFEIIIADDGSDQRTAQLVGEVMTGASVPWRHVRHDDRGIRQARIKNLAVRHATGDYFVFIDHDVALHPDFLGDHVDNLEPECFLQGKRVFLSPASTRRYLARGQFSLPFPLSRGMENRKNAFRLPRLGRLLMRKKTHQYTLRGCNLSMARRQFMTIDGYDETFDGLWGREDSDICYRLFNSGFYVKNLWFSALQYHLHHDSIKRTTRDRLDDELETILHEKRKSALIGYSKLSGEGDIVNESAGF